MRKAAPPGPDRFGAALKGSRLVSLARPIRPHEPLTTHLGTSSSTTTTSGSSLRQARQTQVKQRHPTHQVIHTTPASGSRSEWGLKRNMPFSTSGPGKSFQYVTLDNMDVEGGMTGFSPGAKYALIKKRVQELGHAVRPAMNAQGDLFARGTAASSDANHHQLDTTTTPATDGFRTFLEQEGIKADVVKTLFENEAEVHTLLDKHLRGPNRSTSAPPQAFSSSSLASLPNNSKQHHTDDKNTKNKTNIASPRPVGTAGLLYTLPGTLGTRPPVSSPSSSSSTPSWRQSAAALPLQEGPVIPGRLAHSSGTVAALAGITATCSLSNISLVQVQSRPVVYDTVQGFTVQSLGVTRHGSVDMVVKAVADPRDQASQHIVARYGRKGSLLSKSRRRKQAEADTTGEFLGLVEESLA